MKQLFIVGCGRSGTTMLQQALNRHSQIVIPPETGYFLDFLGHTRAGQRQHIGRINTELGIDVPAPAKRVSHDSDARAWYEDLAGRYMARLDRADATYFGDKSPRHLLVIRRIHRIYPDAKIILIHRDGRDVALSLTSVPWGPADLYVNFAIWLRFYRWHQWAVKHSPASLWCVKYENLVAAPEEELKKIVAFLDLPYETPVATGHGNREGVTDREHAWKARAFEKINTSRIGVGKTELSPGQLRHLERWGAEALRSLGYELSVDHPLPLPWTFFPRLWLKQGVWRAQCAWRLAGKELLSR